MIVDPASPVKRALDSGGHLGLKLVEAVGDLTSRSFDFAPYLFGLARLRLYDVSAGRRRGDELSRISLSHFLSR